HKGPFGRFAWGFSSDTRLNHHPEPPPGIDPVQWQGRRFSSPEESTFYLRIERQVTWGFPEIDAAFFSIRVYYLEGISIRRDPEKREKLVAALKSMTPESRE